MNSVEMLFLKKIKSKHFSLQHPNHLNYIHNNFLCVPRSLIFDGVISYGGSSGSGLKLISKSLGEYWERNHFQTSVPICSEKRLKDIYPVEYRDKLLNLCNKNDYCALDQHKFAMTRVYNLFDNSPTEYFYNAVSLLNLKKDALFLDKTDSISCASHPQKKQALYYSMIEYLERQSLVGSWLSKSYRYSINSKILEIISPYRCLYEQLSTNGRLYIFEIGNHLPGYSVIIFYFADSQEDTVQYSVGSKSAFSLREAINGAFNELYQTFTMLYQINGNGQSFENRAGGGYHAAFPKYNTISTKEIIPYFLDNKDHEIITHADLEKKHIFSFDEILSGLMKISQDIFFYHFYEKSIQLHFTKIVSMDFFAHMSLSTPLNIDGAYAKKLNLTKENAYFVPLPFP